MDITPGLQLDPNQSNDLAKKVTKDTPTDTKSAPLKLNVNETVTKDQVKQILSARPSGTDPKKIIDSLVSRGYKLEGYTPPTKTPFGDKPSVPQDVSKTSGIKDPGFEKTGEFLLGALKSVPNTILNFAKGGEKALETITGVKPNNQDEEAQLDKHLSTILAPKSNAEKLGGVAGDIAQLFIPGADGAEAVKLSDEAIKGLGYSSKITKGIQLGSRFLLKGLMDAGIFKTQGASTKEAVTLGAGGGLLDVATKALPEGFKALRETISGITPNVKTALQQTAMKTFDEYAGIAEKAIKDSSAKTPLEFVGQKAQQVYDTLSKKLNDVGQSMSDILNKPAYGGKVGMGISENTGMTVGDKTVPTIVPSIEKFGKLISDRLGASLDTEGKFASSEGRISKMTPGDKSLLSSVNGLLNEAKSKIINSVREVNDLVDALQKKVYASKGVGMEPITTESEGIVKEIASDLNKQVKKVAGDEFTKANKKYSELKSITDELNKALGNEGDKGAALMNQVFSPSGAKAKRILAQVKKLTGVDLTQETVIAKFVMDAVGDVRQNSRLTDLGVTIPTSSKGLLERSGKFIVDMLLKNPEKAAKYIIKGGS